MDDIDRLTVEEIGRLFWLVKMVADLPNVVYVLVYDRDVVVRALDSLFDGHGLAYLERIVQATVDLPLPGPRAVKRELDLYVREVPEGVSRADVATAIDGLWNGCLEVLVPTLRHAKLLVNAIEVGHALHPAIPAGILVALESLRTLGSGVFDQVRTDPLTYLGGSPAAPTPVAPPGARAGYASAVSRLWSTALSAPGSLNYVQGYFYAG
jgi:predicted KAP-like P-loop ATPase